MAITAQSIVNKAELILQDSDNDRWTEPDLFTWLKLGENEIVKLKPDANPVIESVLLTSGSQQTLPSGAVQLLDVLCNMGTDGSTRGNIVSVVERKLMNSIDPGWMAATAQAYCTHVIYDPKRSPKMFWVYPQSTGTNYLEIMTGKLPTPISAIDQNINLGDEYESALMHFVLAMAFGYDAEYTASGNTAVMHYQLFQEMLGIRDATEDHITPKRTRERD